MERVVGYTNSARYKCLEDLQRTSTDFSLRYCGIEQCNPGHFFGPYVRKNASVLHVILKGKGFFKINGEIYPLHANQAFLIIPEQTTYYEADADEPWEYIWVGFTGIRSFEYLSNCGFTDNNFIIDVPNTEPLKNCVLNMLEAHELTFANDLLRNSELLKFFAILIQNHGENSKKTTYDYPGAIYVNHAIDYITLHYKEQLRIQKLADYIGIDRSYLTSTFKKVKGISPQEFLVNLRMDRAASLLKETTSPINEVASQVGYKDPLAFSKIFKQYYGMSPKNYRNSTDALVTVHKKFDYTPKTPF
ncbi:AraC-family transcriptional regulator [Lachnospiraceae bacterium TWA4]|nr:AraC-family transcriptional regulator [Lachnospiraceae bacterium TWA4]